MGAVRKKNEIEEDRNQITPLYLKGYPLRKIAEKVTEQTGRHVSHVTVKKDIEFILKEFRDDRNNLIEYELTRELEKINQLEYEYWLAWEKSKSDRKRKSIKKVSKGSAGKKSNDNIIDEVTEYNDTEMINMGDPRYLAGIQWCVEQRCKLIGIGNITKVEGSVTMVEQITGMKII